MKKSSSKNNLKTFLKEQGFTQDNLIFYLDGVDNLSKDDATKIEKKLKKAKNSIEIANALFPIFISALAAEKKGER